MDGTQQGYAFETGSLSADTWTKITKTIPGNSNITFDNDANHGLNIEIVAFRGTDKTGSMSLDTWAAYDSAVRVPDMTSTWFTTDDATFEITGVQLEIGDTATPFEHKTYGQELRGCQRYYQTYATGFFGYVVTTSVIDAAFSFRQRMRASPSVTLLDDSPTFNELNISIPTGSSSSITTSANHPDGTGMVRIDGFGGATANKVAIGYNGSTDMLGFDAEL
jgi:hypothetical protein